MDALVYSSAMKSSIFICLILSFSLLPIHLYANAINYLERESSSYYIKEKQRKRLDRLYRKVSPEYLKSKFVTIFNDQQVANCGINILDQLQLDFPKLYSKQSKNLILALRDLKIVDDVVVGILNRARDINSIQENGLSNHQINRIKNKEALLVVVNRYLRRIEQKTCPTDAYKTYVQGIRKAVGSRKFNRFWIKKVDYLALSKGILTTSQFRQLVSFRHAKVDSWNTSLEAYNNTLSKIRRIFPIPEGLQASGFMSKKALKEKRSFRQRLYETYDTNQIALMADIVQRMRKRFDSPRIDITIWQDEGTVAEIVTLEPMDRYRIILKLMRKEMSELMLNVFMNGRNPTYTDLITAAHEVNYIPFEEVEPLAKLEEIWDPEKTWWEKAQFWVKTAGTTAAVLLSPPWGFISVLGVMIIEETAKDDPSGYKDFNLIDL